MKFKLIALPQTDISITYLDAGDIQTAVDPVHVLVQSAEDKSNNTFQLFNLYRSSTDADGNVKRCDMMQQELVFNNSTAVSIVFWEHITAAG